MDPRQKKILVVSSPTGGHLYPAIEVSKQLLKLGYNIIFVTQKNTNFVNLVKTELEIEDSLSNKKNILTIETVPATKFSRTNPVKMFTFLISVLNSFLKMVKLLLIHRPKLVFSTGGYTSVSVILAFKFLFPLRPIVLQEQNYVFGLTNKFLSVFATKICCGFPSKKIKNSKKYIFTGNPVRESLKTKVDPETVYKKFGFDKDKFTILIFGGSQGAKVLNDLIIKILKVEEERFKNVQIIHLTGETDFNRIKDLYKDIKVKHILFPYLTTMYEAYNIADLVISRCGAMTISELIYFQKPAILVPFPFAAEFHQNWNAQYLKLHNCAVVVYQKDGWEKIFYKRLVEFLENKKLLFNYRNNFKFISYPKDAKQNIANIISSLV
jgi:UDP-N-acetylglucosamine--N-acetylmuramyl-(pentapeptide) pyrophosphoryl-undecaprenol N-acetylglucosamine transferase